MYAVQKRGFALPTVLIIVAVLAIGAVLLYRNSFVPSSTPPETTGQSSKKVLAGMSAPLLDFNKSDYATAKNSGKLVVLYFYANWCPICKVETVSALYPAFNDLSRPDVIGFRVNYNDNQTDNDEKDLAREFGVAYQHTKVFLKNGVRILKAPDSWNKDRYIAEITKAAQ